MRLRFADKGRINQLSNGVTYRALLEQTKEHFTDIASAEYLLQGITNKNRAELYLDSSSVSENLVKQFQDLLQKRKPDMPVQYLSNKAYFLSLELYVDERVMIPRFETEELVVKTAERLQTQRLTLKTILDIGTGSGAIAIALADLFHKAKIIATDISTQALDVALINIRKYGLEDRITVCHTNLFTEIWSARIGHAPLLHSKNSFDLIISNPPYIPEDEINDLTPTVKNYEPRLALNGGKNGFEIIERIIGHASSSLAPNGLLALEIDPRQEELIRAVAPNAEFEKDNQGLIRYAFI